MKNRILRSGNMQQMGAGTGLTLNDEKITFTYNDKPNEAALRDYGVASARPITV